jgi:hypothetical protein
VVYQFSGTGFQRQPFSFLRSWSVPVPQHSNPWLTVHSWTLIFWNCILLLLDTSQQLLLYCLELCPITADYWNWSEVAIDGQSASQPWCRAPIWNSWPDFSFLSDNCKFLAVGHPLWREDGHVIYLYNCFWVLPEQPLSDPSPAELTIFCCLIWASPKLEGQIPLLISPINTVAQLYPRILSSLFVATYYSQSQSHITTDSRSSYQAPVWDPRPIFLSPWDFLLGSYCLLCCSAFSDERNGSVNYCSCWSSPAQSR